MMWRLCSIFELMGVKLSSLSSGKGVLAPSTVIIGPSTFYEFLSHNTCVVRWPTSANEWVPQKSLHCDKLLQQFVRQVEVTRDIPKPGDVDVVCGGPPCQVDAVQQHCTLLAIETTFFSGCVWT